jgi:UDP-galactopyranose mutase
MRYDYLIVGAGFSGCVLAERIASQLNKKVLILDKRGHIGGNAYDYYNQEGILVHKYGAHLFHTNNKKVFNYIRQFTDWRPYEHRVLSCIDGKKYPFPINRNTLNKLYHLSLETEEDVKKYYGKVREKIDTPKNAEEMVLSLVGKDLFEKFYKNYTYKQWGIDAKQLSPGVTARIPIRTNGDNRYFADLYQGVPLNGYTEMFKKMTRHRNITVELNTDYKSVLDLLEFDKMIYTGAIDEYFDFIYGKLPYRSLKFEHETLDMEYYQNVNVVNYPNDYDFTRIIEWKHATGQNHLKTSITREFPMQAEDGSDKYYPIPRDENSKLYTRYKDEAEKLKSVLFCGRLADYKYYNMDQVTARALKLFGKKVC